MGKLIKLLPEDIGVFATHAPMRPNPVLSSTVNVIEIDFDKGIIHTPHIDAVDGTPVLDIKPYHMMERVRDCNMPDWASHWPVWYEDAADYDWDKEINK
jgi:tRNA (Thr-GGU) A37 N-methylase